MISNLPFKLPIVDLNGRFRTGWTGSTVAMERPRLVTVIVPPLALTSSINSRHFALNSVAVTTRLVMHSSYQAPNCSHLDRTVAVDLPPSHDA